MNSVIILEFKSEESLECFIKKRKLKIIERGNRIAIVSGSNPSELAIKLSSEIGPLSVRLAFQFKDYRSIFEEYLTRSKIKNPVDFSVTSLKGVDQIKLYYNLVEEAINTLPGLRISEVEPKAVYNVFIGESSYLEIWSDNGIGGNACSKDEMIGIFFTGSKESFNITFNAIKSGYNLKLFYPYIDESSLRNAVYLTWRLAKLGNITLLVYRESGTPSLNGLTELLLASKTIKTMIIPCEVTAKIGARAILKAVMSTGITPLVLGCLDEIKESKTDDIKPKFNNEIYLSDISSGKPVAVEVTADPSNMGMHIMLDSIVPHLLDGNQKL
ncbi:MAG: hypothetical protein QXY52_06545 [Conexivisphaerales archaeon]